MQIVAERAWRRWLAVLLAAALLAAGCGDDGGDSDDGAAAPTSEPTTTEAPNGEDAGGGGEADVRVVTVETPDGPGPDEYDRVRVLQHGPEDAENVLVLVPGTSAGAGYFSPFAQAIVEELPGWQVWAVDRRENLLEDHSVLGRRLAGEATAQEVFDYYLGWIGNDAITERFQPPTDDEVAFAREWGMNVAIEDLAAVIDEAAALGGKVVLGGHSLGGTITVAYATWDFEGRAGVEDLDGLVFIDGGSAAGGAPSVEELQAELAGLEAGSPFNDLVGLGLPWAAGVFNALGATAVLLEPDEPSLAYDWPPFPAQLRPPVRPTNAAQYGYALDVDTSPANLALVHLHLGELAPSGDPRGWVDGDLIPVTRAATMFAGVEGVDGTAWYHPRRLSIDGGTVNGGMPNPAQEVVGVRAVHGADLDVPILAFETSFGQGRVLAAARSVAEHAGLPESDLTLVEAHDLTHTDPLAIVPSRNPLLEALVPFLDGLG